METKIYSNRVNPVPPVVATRFNTRPDSPKQHYNSKKIRVIYDSVEIGEKVIVTRKISQVPKKGGLDIFA